MPLEGHINENKQVLPYMGMWVIGGMEWVNNIMN